MKTKTLILGVANGKQRKLVIPGDAKVTFGAVCVGSSGKNYGGQHGWCLRIYRGNGNAKKDDPIAIFTDIQWFREEGPVSILEKVSRTKTKKVGKRNKAGHKDASASITVTKWVDPDAPDDDQEEADWLNLPSGEDGDPEPEVPF